MSVKNEPSSDRKSKKNEFSSKKYYRPQKFTFDVVEADSYQDMLNESQRRYEQAEKLNEVLPALQGFPTEEIDYKQGYDALSNAIQSMYNGIRNFAVEHFMDQLEELVSEYDLKTPMGCLQFIGQIVDKSDDLFSIDFKNQKKETQNFELHLQKAENKIRDFIRNEQIYKLNFDNLNQKVEELEKKIQELESALDLKHGQIQELTSDNQKLVAIVKKKDDELKRLREEAEKTLEKLNSQTINSTMNTNHSTAYSPYSQPPDYSYHTLDSSFSKDNRAKTPGLKGTQTLEPKILTETLRLTPTQDLQTILHPSGGAVRQQKPSNKTPTPSRKKAAMFRSTPQQEPTPNSASLRSLRISMGGNGNSEKVKRINLDQSLTRESLEKSMNYGYQKNDSSETRVKTITRVYLQDRDRYNNSKPLIREREKSDGNRQHLINQSMQNPKISNNRYGSIEPKYPEQKGRYFQDGEGQHIRSKTKSSMDSYDGRVNKSLVHVRAKPMNTENSPDVKNRSTDLHSEHFQQGKVKSVNYFIPVNVNKRNPNDVHHSKVSKSQSSIRSLFVARPKK